MQKFLVLMLISIFTIAQTYAYAIKVYDEYGNRIGTYRKSNEKYEFYDFHENKVENPEDVIQNPPSQKTLIEIYQGRIYNPDMMPLDTYSNRLYDIWDKNSPKRYSFPPSVNMPREPYIVCPRTKNLYPYNGNGYYYPNHFNKKIPSVH